MNRKSNHQNLLRTALTTAGTNVTRWAVTLALVMITMLALPTGAWAQDPATGESGTSQAGVVENGYNTGEVGQNGGGSGISGYYIPFTIALYANGQITENNAVGTASSDPAYVERDHIEITITATANPGYKFREWQSKSTGISFTVNDNKNATYSFTHPGGTTVSFTAVFEVDPDYQGGSGQTGTNDSPNIQPENPDQPANPSQPVNPDQPVSGGLDENTVYPLGAGVMNELESGNTTIGESGKTIHYQVEAGGFTIKTGQTLRIVGNIVIDIPSGRKITLEPGTDLILEVGNSLTFNGQGKLEGGGTITNNGTITFNEGTVDLTGTGSIIVNNRTTNIKCKNFSVSKIQGGTLIFNQGAVSYLYFGELEVNGITIDSSCSYFYNFDIYNKPVAGKLLRVDRYPWLPDDSKENSSYIATKDGMYLSSNNSYTYVYLVGRTFHRDGKWHTICLPFNYKKDVSFSGTIIRPLTNASISGTTLALTFGAPVTEMEAGVPYIVKWDVTEPSTITDPYILGQMVSKAMQNYDNGVSGAGRVRFIGTYDAIDYDTEDKSILLFDDDNKLYFPENGTHIGGFRGYFKIGEDGTEPSKVTAFKMNFSDEPGVDHDAVVIVPDAEVTPEPEMRLLSLGKGWDAHGAVTASYIIEGMTEAEDITENLTVESAFPVPEGATVTLTITPGEDYVVDKVTVTKVEPQEVIGGGFESRTRGDGDDAVVVSHTAGTDVWSFTMPAYDAEATVTYKEKTAQKKTIEAGWITVDVGGGLTYNGQEQKPSVTVKDGTTTLSAETDYEVTYSNNMNACEATAENAPTVTVTVKDGNDTYSGSASVTFAIGKAKVKASGFAVEDKEKNGDDVTAVLITTDVTLDGVITGSGDKQGDEVDIKDVTGTFEDAEPGKNKTVNLDYTNASLTGKDAGNYTLDRNQSQPTATGKIYIKPTEGIEFRVDGLKYKITNDDPCEVELTGREKNLSGAFAIPATITYAGIDYSVTNIGVKAFKDCRELTSVSIPSSVTSIGNHAFDNCGELMSVTIPSSVTSIGNFAFAYTDLSSVTIPSSVTSIGNGTFHNCQSLTTITVDGNNTAYKSVDGVLFNYDGSKLIRYPCGKSGTSYTVPDVVTIIEESAFDNCNGLKEVNIPSTVTNIGANAFQNCSALVSVTIHAQSLTEYGKNAFDYNASGRKIYVPDGSVDTYKAGWSAYAKDIEAIPAPVPLVDATPDHQRTVDGKGYAPLTSSGASQLGVKAGDGIYLESAAASRMMIAENGGIEVKGKESMYMLAAGLEDGSKLQVGGSGFTPFAQMGGSSLRAESGARTRGDGDMQLVIGKVYEVVGNGDIILTFVPDNENGMTIKAIDITPKVNLDESAAQQPLGENLKDRNIRMTYERTIDAPTDAAHDVELDGQNATLFTVCLPEAPEIAAGVKYYKLSGATATSFTFTEVETPVAFTPYVAAVTATSNFQIKYPDITFDTGAALGSFSADGYTLKGTLTGIIHANAIGLLILQGQGNWGTVVSGKTGAYVPPFRAYIEADNVSGARTVGSSFGDDATAVRSIRTIDKDGTERMYDLQGRRIDQPAKKGIYIINGRKEVLK